MNHHFSSYCQPQRQVVYHYHYHHFVDQPSKTKILTKAKSSSNLRNSNLNNADNQSTSSRQSWKNLIIPAFQSNDVEITSDIKYISPNSANSHVSNTARGMQSEKISRLDLTERKDYLSPKATKRQRLSSTAQTIDNQPSNLTIQEPSFGTLAENQLSKINPQNLEKSSFSKKYQLNSTADILKSQLVLPQSSIIDDYRRNNYAFQLLEQECKYLRKKFLKHYLQNHPQKEKKEDQDEKEKEEKEVQEQEKGDKEEQDGKKEEKVMA